MATPIAKKNIHITRPISQRERKMYEAMEVLDAIGHENERDGIKWTRYFMNEFDFTQIQMMDAIIEKLKTDLKISKKKYNKHLNAILWTELSKLDLPLGYATNTEITDKGIMALMKDGFERTYYMAFTPSGEPKKDYFAIMVITSSCEEKAIELENLRTARINIIKSSKINGTGK